METNGAGETEDSGALRRLPAVHVVLGHESLGGLIERRGRDAVVRGVRAAIDEARARLRAGELLPADAGGLAARARALVEAGRPGLRPVINATGILLHTGLGRAPLAEEAAAAVAAAARGFCNLEFRLEDGERGRRTTNVARLLAELTGAAAATVVNNNAAATVLALRALAAGREVIVSRGQLVEIGGSFRLPEIFEVSGARLREVGTTNKTRLSDYAKAVGPETAAILRVHGSNFRIVGFTEQAPLGGLAELAREHRLLLIDDIGSGALAPGLPPGVDDEPTVAEGIGAGADLVLFSGDKLLGGPQCGVMVGTSDAIRRIEADPLMRALRVDKLTLAALETTLGLILDGEAGRSRIPLWRMMGTSLPDLEARATRLAARLRDELGLNAAAVASESFIGGGSVPVRPIPTMAVSVAPPFPAPFDSEAAWARALRSGEPPVVPRVRRAPSCSTCLPWRAEEPILLDAMRRMS
ncbi:MAG: L-seryl-tRNA(Sec) selenium transferase [Isosphaeraceae bacterium]